MQDTTMQMNKFTQNEMSVERKMSVFHLNINKMMKMENGGGGM